MFRQIVDRTPALIHTARPDGFVDFLNQGWLDFAGRPLEALIGWGWAESFHPDDIGSCMAKWLAALQTGEPFEAEGRVRRADGVYRTLVHRKIAVRDASGQIVKWYGSSTDVEEQKRAEQDLRRSEAMRVEERAEERLRLARDLHDTLLQSLQGLVLRFQGAHALLPAHPDEAKAALALALERADQALAEGRNAVQGLRLSTRVVAVDFANALQVLGDDLVASRASGALAVPTFSVRVDGTPKLLSAIVSDECYQIAREAIRNALRHAHAERITAVVSYGEQRFELRVRDDGVGIDTGQLDPARLGRWGLAGMRERADRVDATLVVRALDRGGTEVHVSVPSAAAYRTSPVISEPRESS
jgi:PAS domain S-box-containing protein